MTEAVVDQVLREPGLWAERAGMLGLLVAACVVLGVALFYLFRWFIRRVDAAESKCEARNAELTKEIVGVRELYEKTLAGEMADQRRIIGENTTAMREMTAAAREMAEIARGFREDTHRIERRRID